jgi:hypothetical protein
MSARTLPHFKKAAAFAVFNDTWAGELVAGLVPSKTTRGGVRMTVWTWTTERGSAVGIWRSAFQNPQNAITAAKRHPSFKDVEAVEAAAPAGWSHVEGGICG